jgi:hypothetical protein
VVYSAALVQFVGNQVVALVQVAECALALASADIPADFAIVDRFPIVLMLNRMHAADLILPPPAEDSAAVKTMIEAVGTSSCG